MTFLNKPWPWFLAFAIWVATLFSLSAQSQLPPVGPELPNMDKVLHVGFFFGGAIFLSFAFLNQGWSQTFWQHLAKVLLVMAFIGATDEFHQSFTEGRSGNDVGDLVADIFGGLLGALLVYRIHPWVTRFLRPASN